MRRPHMSTGAWIFASVVAAAIIAPAGVYAAASQTVAIGNAANSATATVNSIGQLQTNPTGPKNIVHFSGTVFSGACGPLYQPPAGKGIVLTEVSVDIGTGAPGAESYGGLTDASCQGPYDIFDTIGGYEIQSRTYPVGLPMAGVGYNNLVGNGYVFVTGVGYLIPAAQVPAAAHGMITPKRWRAYMDSRAGK
ncbi:MAG: hypothetical protein JO214_14160 [Frankiaceae bacterium]|nr:hypothetical protein [Frankiaceae bacterium]